MNKNKNIKIIKTNTEKNMTDEQKQKYKVTNEQNQNIEKTRPMNRNKNIKIIKKNIEKNITDE